MIFAFVAVSAIVPSLLLLWYFHSRDVLGGPCRKKILWPASCTISLRPC